MYELKGNDRKIGAQYDTVLINSVLEGHTGRMLVDSLINPQVSRLDTGAFTMLAGNTELAHVSEMIGYSPIFIVTPESEDWENVLVRYFGQRISRLPFVAYHANAIDSERLLEVVDQLPNGYEIKKLNKVLCERLPNDIQNEYFLENFNSIEDFLSRGIGFCVLLNGKIVSAATSMASSKEAIDVEIETSNNFRNLGLGTIVGAKLIHDCIRNNITPKWLAANEGSARLAERLGFTRGESYDTFEIGD